MDGVNRVQAIAWNTFTETIRDRFLYGFVFFSFLVVLLSVVLGSLSIGQELRILEDLGLAAVALIGGVIAIFVGTSLVYKEIERRTILIILSKPVRRWQFVLGKYLGLCLCVFIVTLLMGAFLLGIIAAVSPGHVVNPLLIEAICLIYLELLFVIAIATFFSTFATPIMSVLFTLGVWFIGHMGPSIRQLGILSGSSQVAGLCDFLYWLMPDFAVLTQIRGGLMYGHQPEPEMLSFLISYVFAYIVLVISISTLITEKKEFP